MFPLSNLYYLDMFCFIYSMSNETTDDCGHAPYEKGCLVESFQGIE